MTDHQQMVPENDMSNHRQQIIKLKRWQWWVLVVANIAFLLIGQSGAVILGKLYYDEGGKSLWMGALVQTAAFPVLYLPFFFFPNSPDHNTPPNNPPNQPSLTTKSSIYFSLGLLLGIDNILYTLGLIFLPLSTYSILCATQLIFNSIFSFFINKEKPTPLIFTSVFLLTLSAMLVAIHGDYSTKYKDAETDHQKSLYIIGFFCTIAASAAYALLLSLMQFSFDKVLKKESLGVVLEMQIYTSLVATIVCMVGLFASGDFLGLKKEMEGFNKKSTGYVLTLVGTALAWQICSVGILGLIFLVSSLFSNFISMLCLPFVPLFALIAYGEEMNAIKIVAMVLGILGFASYLYQNHLDDRREQKIGHR